MVHSGFSSYLTWSDEEEKRFLVCTDVGYAIVPAGSPYPAPGAGHPDAFRSVATGRVVQEYQLVYITAGQGRFSSERVPGSEVTEGSVIFVFPGSRHSYCPDPETGWEERWVGFKGPAVDMLRIEEFVPQDSPVIKIGVRAGILSLFDSIFEAVRVQDPLYQFRAGSLVLLLLSEIIGCAHKASQRGGTDTAVEIARSLMAEGIDHALDMDAIGERVGLSRDRFGECFKSYTGMSPYQYFLHLKINRAKELLSGEDVLVKEVAAHLGFEDQYYFSRLFKKKTGMAPSDWKGRGTLTALQTRKSQDT